jgi:filamentous hemagglutinin family protein
MARCSSFPRLAGATLAWFGLTVASLWAQTPEGGRVVAGHAAIETSGSETRITQSSDRAVIDWRRFDVGSRSSVVFEQPGARSATLNRVTVGAGSRIEGVVQAPGTVIIQNEAGVLFTGTARIEVGGLVATAGRVDPEAFQRGASFGITGGGHPGARVANEGRITIGRAGLGALVGRHVENSGVIVADRGVVALASGERTVVDMSGDGLLKLAVDEPIRGGRIEHSGTIEVGAGQVLLSAGSASGVLDGVINTSGLVRAGSASATGGQIRLEGASDVRVAGRMDASGERAGGTIEVSGRSIALAPTADLAANGAGAGGRVLVGGDIRGTGPLPRAANLTVAPGARASADGGVGSGGEIVFWSDEDTAFGGRASAYGAAAGGLVETSGAGRLHVGETARVSVGSGTWLLDPRDVVIGSDGLSPVSPGTLVPPVGASPFRISVGALVDALDSGADVKVATGPVPGTISGAITVIQPIVWSGNGNLLLEANADIRILSAIRSAGAGNFTADANRTIVVQANVEASGSGSVRMIARSGDLSMEGGSSTDTRIATDTGALSLEANKGSLRLTRGPSAGGGMVAITSGTGSVTMRARDQVILGGGDEIGEAALVGGPSSAAPISIEGGDIRIVGNAGGAWLTSAGPIALLAREGISVTNGAGPASIETRAGASLSLRARRQTWEGSVAAGGPEGGGDVTLSGTIVVSGDQRFDLRPDATFRLLGLSPVGTPSSLDGAGTVAVTTTGAGTVSLDAPLSAETVRIVSEERVVLGAGGALTATGSGDALVVAAGRGFVNGAGAAALTAVHPTARWLLYLDSFDGLSGAPGARDFDLYGRPFGAPGSAPSALGYAGNRIVYAERPVVWLTAWSQSKTYGATALPGVSVSALRVGDTIDTAFDGPVSASSSGSDATAPAGIIYSTQVLPVTSSQGYDVRRVDGILTVLPAPLIVRARDMERRPGANAPAFSASFSGFVPGESADNLEGQLAFETTAAKRSPPGRYSITPHGLTSANYDIEFVDGTLTIAAAAPAPAGFGNGVDRYVTIRRGVGPLTPADASFRTQAIDAPPALSQPFSLGYSLGEIGTLAPQGPATAASAETTSGFVPAAGGLEGREQAGEAGCSGNVRLPEQDACVMVLESEDFWSTRNGNRR